MGNDRGKPAASPDDDVDHWGGILFGGCVYDCFDAIEALGRIGTPEATEYLVVALYDKVEDVRVKAARQLAARPSVSLIETFIMLLGDASWFVRKAGADALLQLYTSGGLTEPQRRRIRVFKPVITQPHYDEVSYRKVRDKEGRKRWVLVRDNFGIGLPWPTEE